MLDRILDAWDAILDAWDDLDLRWRLKVWFYMRYGS